MLSDEEKQAIEYLKSRLYGNEGCKFIDVAQNDLRIFLKLVEKQSKEIEELKEDKYGLEEEVQIQVKNLMLYENALYEIQNKIKAKIEEVKDGTFDAKIVLQSLLEKE